MNHFCFKMLGVALLLVFLANQAYSTAISVNGISNAVGCSHNNKTYLLFLVAS